MKKFIFLILMAISINAYGGGGGHFHPKKVAKCGNTCSEEQIKEGVYRGVKELVKWNKMDAKWETSTIENIEKKTFKKSDKSLTAWVVTLSENAGTENKSKKFVFFTEDGLVFRTNSTGVLK